jgi:hypothetical protein
MIDVFIYRDTNLGVVPGEPHSDLQGRASPVAVGFSLSSPASNMSAEYTVCIPIKAMVLFEINRY